MEMAHVIICLNKIVCTEKNKKNKKNFTKTLDNGGGTATIRP